MKNKQVGNTTIWQLRFKRPQEWEDIFPNLMELWNRQQTWNKSIEHQFRNKSH